MSLQYTANEYAIPRGRIFFDRFDSAGARTGEQAFGNCPGFTFTTETTKAEHYSSEGGLREKDAALTIEVNRSGELTCDNFSTRNFALFVSGVAEMQAQAAATVVDEAMAVKQGLFYQIGATQTNPAGARNITAVTVKDSTGTTPFVLGTDFNLDPALARLQIIEGGGIADDVTVKLGYTTAVASWERVKSGSVSEVSGAMRIIADNASGANRDWYFPKVTLTSSGDIPVIAEGTDFVQMKFGVEILKPANQEALYVDGRPI